MITLPHAILSALRANARASRLHEQRDERFDPFPVVKFFNPVGAATWMRSRTGTCRGPSAWGPIDCHGSP